MTASLSSATAPGASEDGLHIPNDPMAELCAQARWFATRSWRQFVTDPDVAGVMENRAVRLALLIEAAESGLPPTPIHQPRDPQTGDPNVKPGNSKVASQPGYAPQGIT